MRSQVAGDQRLGRCKPSPRSSQGARAARRSSRRRWRLTRAAALLC